MIGSCSGVKSIYVGCIWGEKRSRRNFGSWECPIDNYENEGWMRNLEWQIGLRIKVIISGESVLFEGIRIFYGRHEVFNYDFFQKGKGSWVHRDKIDFLSNVL